MRDRLIEAVIEHRDKFAYINLDENNNYRGWVSDFNIIVDSNRRMRLDLSVEEDLFLLFVLASAWSKTGPWENAAFFTTYLKESKKNKIELWLDDNFLQQEICSRDVNAMNIANRCNGVTVRKKVSFRRDYYNSIKVLAENWSNIKAKLKMASEQNDFMIFINYLSTIEGLGAGKNKMRIKIPLILRELRCQGIYDNIPGELCCVPDERVKVSAVKIGIKLPHINSMKSLLKASKIIYDNFGDLYDIPLFAYEDLEAQL